MSARRLHAAIGILLCGVLGGCGGHGADDESSPPAADFRGVYRATGPGPIASIGFSADHSYMLMPDGCAAEACAELGVYSLDARRTTLSLTNSKTGQARTLAVTVLSTTPAGGAGAAAPKDVSTLLGSGGALTNGASSLTQGTAMLLSILSALLGGQGFGSDPSNADNTPPPPGQPPTCDSATNPDPFGGDNVPADPDDLDPDDRATYCLSTFPTRGWTQCEVDAYFQICPQGFDPISP